MKSLSLKLLSETVIAKRKAHNITQAQLASAIGMSRSVLSNLENATYTPSIHQLEALAQVLEFDCRDMFVENGTPSLSVSQTYRIAVAGTGYVGLSLAVLLAQHHEVTAVTTTPSKAEKINNFLSPIQDEYIERYLKEAQEGERTLNLTATTDGASAYANADYIVLGVPTNYDPKTNYFDCSAVEDVISLILDVTADQEKKPTIVIKSTVPVGYTEMIREKFHCDRIIFSPEFLRESKALYDNLYPSRIIVGCNEETQEEAKVFASLLQQGALKESIETLFMGFTEAEATKLFVNT